ncbi:MAG: hypothetical protein MUE94_11465 [Verrucomicrobia bacterium]|jgi:hypothetical protein|nr:hypothetical protein [Verrucomicrobiota bacterium]
MSFEDGGLTLRESPGLSERAVTVDFPFEEVYARLDGPPPPDPHEQAAECLRHLFRWVNSGASFRDCAGFVTRSAIVSWIVCPENHALSMTDVAGRFGKKKQSLGRWVDDFKLQFPQLCQHAHHLRASNGHHV